MSISPANTTQAADAPPKKSLISKSTLISCFSFTAFLLIWESVCRLGLISEFLLVPPTQLFATFIEKLGDPAPDGATLFEHIKTSLRLVFLGFSFAVCIGLPLGLLMGWYEPVRRCVRPVFDCLRPIPPISWIPLAITWLGLGDEAKAFIICLAGFVPSVLNAYTGIRLTNPVLIRVARIYGASNAATFFKIGIPSAVPMIFTGLRLSLNSSWATLVAAELLAASQGLGYLIQTGRRMIRPDLIIMGMLVIGCTGAFMAILLGIIEKRIASSNRR